MLLKVRHKIFGLFLYKPEAYFQYQYGDYFDPLSQ